MKSGGAPKNDAMMTCNDGRLPYFGLSWSLMGSLQCSGGTFRDAGHKSEVGGLWECPHVVFKFCDYSLQICDLPCMHANQLELGLLIDRSVIIDMLTAHPYRA